MYKECCIWYELHSRDSFERMSYPPELAGLSDTARMAWDCAKFYCYCCKELVGLPHFPIRQVLESITNRTEMSKITKRECFAHVTPVQLWGNSVVTWERLQEVRKKLRRLDRHRAVRVLDWDCHSTCYTISELHTDNSKLPPSTPDTLTLHRVFPDRVEARAEYFVDLYKPLRFRAANASIIIDLVDEKQPYICPHLDLTKVLHRLMVYKPINFGSSGPSHDPTQTVVEVMLLAMERIPWGSSHNAVHTHPNNSLCKIKGQSIWCGFEGNKCRTEITLQRLRDNQRWSMDCMRDSVRLKVVRKWRIDCETGNEEWQTQNGTSAMAKSMVVKRKGFEVKQ